MRFYKAMKLSYTLTDTSKLDKESAKLKSEIEVVTELLQKCVEENAHSALNQAEYEDRYITLAERYKNIKKGLEEINDKRLERSAKGESIDEFIKELVRRDVLVTGFDEQLWNATIEKVVVHSEHEITFTFKDGIRVEYIRI
jgi:site-specific DNA recombinase